MRCIRDREQWIACLSLSLSAKYLQGQRHTWNLREQKEDNSFWPEEYDKVVLQVVSFFSMAFDPIFRWLQELIIPRNTDNLEFLQLAQCAYADDLAVASSSFRGFMTALAPASLDSTPKKSYNEC